jgi:hypothetical protein
LLHLIILLNHDLYHSAIIVSAAPHKLV